MLDNKQILAANLTKLLDTRSESRLALSKRIGVADGSLGRIKYGTGNPTLEALEKIAHFFRLEVWHLFIPDLDPANPPVLAPTSGESTSWPFKRIEAAEIGCLSQSDLDYIEGRLTEALTSAGFSKIASGE